MASHPKKTHHHHGKPLPHLHDALDPQTGRADNGTLKEGAAAWQAAIDDKQFEIETVTEIPIPGDPTRDVIMAVRHKLT